MNDTTTAPIEGEVAPGFEPVREAFVDNFTTRNELGAACAVYHRGERVVDLWGGYKNIEGTAPWTENTLVLVFSTTKGMAATAMALAHAQGRFEYDDRVASHWNEFGRKGKDEITIRQLLSHQAGLPAAMDTELTPLTVADREYLTDLLVETSPDWVPGTRHGYHAFTLGWYESELLRRTDPRDRSLGQFFAEEIADPLDLHFHIGLPDDVPANRIADIDGFHPFEMLTHLHEFPWRMLVSLLNPRSITARALSPFDIRAPAQLNEPAYREVEIPAGNGIGRVRDVAKVYGLLAIGGIELGLDTNTFSRIAAPSQPPSGGRYDVVLKTETSYSLGYWKPFAGFRFGSSDRAFGTHGAGGSFAFADPDRELGFAYAPNRMGVRLWNDPRERALRNAVYDCLV